MCSSAGQGYSPIFCFFKERLILIQKCFSLISMVPRCSANTKASKLSMATKRNRLLWDVGCAPHGPYCGCQKAPILAFGPNLSSYVLTVRARTISETVSLL